MNEETYELKVICKNCGEKQVLEIPREIKEIELSKYQQERLKEYKRWIFKSRGGKEKNPILSATTIF